MASGGIAKGCYSSISTSSIYFRFTDSSFTGVYSAAVMVSVSLAAGTTVMTLVGAITGAAFLFLPSVLDEYFPIKRSGIRI